MRRTAFLVCTCTSALLLLCLQFALLDPPPTSTQLARPSWAGPGSRRLPDVLIIGVRKGGTRALINALALHPQIRAAKREQHFFDDDELYARGIEWYRMQMPRTKPGQIVIEKTPAYFTNAKVPERVFKFNPNLKIILIVRNPVDRTISDFTQVQTIRAERNLTLLSFNATIFTPQRKLLNVKVKPVSNSLYAEHMANWLDYFALNQFLIVNGDRFRINPIKEIRRVERFLGLNRGVHEWQMPFNEQKGFYCFRTGAKEKCLGEGKGRQHVQVDKYTMERMAELFVPYNHKFFRQINTRFVW